MMMNVGVLVPTLIVLCVGALSSAHAISPHAQYESGVPIGGVICPDEMVLLESPRGTPACVTESSVEKLVQRGFSLISLDESGDKPMIKANNPDHKAPFEPAIMDAISGSNQLAFDIYANMADSDENIFFSPPALYLALSALYEGADPAAAEQIQRAISLEPDTKKRHDSVMQLLSIINQNIPYTTLDISNALWSADPISDDDAYVELLNDIYQTDVEYVDLTVREDRIDDWAAENTHNTITDILYEPINNSALITSANHFAGAWLWKFEDKIQLVGNFTNSSGEGILTNFMSVKLFGRHAILDDANIYILDYKIMNSPSTIYDKGLSMLLISPNRMDGIRSVEESLTPATIRHWIQQTHWSEFNFYMPKFVMDTSHDLKDPLIDLGVSDVFDGNIPNTDISNDLLIKDVRQVAFMVVNHTGISHDFGSGIHTSAERPSFAVKHPFIFIIQDEKSETILFMGRLSNPL